ncbi:MAG: hypothetical protein ACRYHQ_14620 [Janthinobacterium lividum]
MAEAYKVGTEILLTSNVVGVMETLSREMRGFGRLVSDTQEHVGRLESSLKSLGQTNGALREMAQSLRALNKAGGTGNAGGVGGNASGRAAEREAQAQERALATAARGQERMDREHMRALEANAAFDRKAQQAEFDRAYALGNLQNRNIDTAARAQEQMDKDHFRALQMNDEFDRKAKQTAFNRDRASAELENQARDRAQKAKPTMGGVFHGAESDASVVGGTLEQIGDMVLHLGGEFVHARGEYDQQLALITNTQVKKEDGTYRPMNAEERADIEATVARASAATKGSTLTGNMEILNDLRGVFGDMKEAQSNLQPFVHLVTGLQMIDMKHGGGGDLHQAMNTARFIEDQGGAKDPTTGKYNDERFQWIANKLLNIAVESRGQITPQSFLAMQKQGRTAGMNLNDTAMYGLTPYFMNSLGASRFGTALFSDMQVMLAGRMDQTHERMFEQLHLIKPGSGHEVKGKDGKKHFEYNPADLVGAETASSNIYKWIHETLAPTVAAFYHIDTKTAEGQNQLRLKLTGLAQRAPIGGMWADVDTNYETAVKGAGNIDAQSPDFVAHELAESIEAQILAMKSAWTDFKTIAGEPLMKPVGEAITAITNDLRELGGWIDRNRELTGEIIRGIGYFGLFTLSVGALLTAIWPMASALRLLGVAKDAFYLLTTGMQAVGPAAVAARAGMAGTASVVEAEAVASGAALRGLGLSISQFVGGVAAIGFAALASYKIKQGMDYAIGGADDAISHSLGIKSGNDLDYMLRHPDEFDAHGRPLTPNNGLNTVNTGGLTIPGVGTTAGPTNMTGVLMIDGQKMGTFAAKTTAAGVMAPQSGLSGPNIRLSSQPSGLSLPGI